jgi:hypothetical protein
MTSLKIVPHILFWRTLKSSAVDKICGAASLKPLNVAFLQFAVPNEKTGFCNQVVEHAYIEES